VANGYRQHRAQDWQAFNLYPLARFTLAPSELRQFRCSQEDLATLALFTVETFKGCQAGWQAAGRQALPLAQAERRLALFNRINGQERLYRLAPAA
jgi:hypothetical protein